MTTYVVTAVDAYVETTPEPLPTVTAVDAYVETTPEPLPTITTVAAYVETTGVAVAHDIQRITSVAAYIEQDGGDSQAATHVAAQIELEGGDSQSATQVAAYIESEQAGYSATNVSAYAEIEHGDDVSITQVGIYVEVAVPPGSEAVSATSVSAYVEVPTTLDELIVSKVTALLATQDGGASASQFASYVEYTQDELYVTKFGVLVEIDEVILNVPTYFSRRNPGPASLVRLPDEVTGYALDPERSFWSIIVPEATVNYCGNPSWENDNIDSHSKTSWAATPTIIDTFPYASRGARFAYCLPTANTFAYLWYTWNATVGPWTFSCDVFGTPGEQFLLQLYSSGVITSKLFTIKEARWNRYEVTGIIPGSQSVNARLVANDNNGGFPFYTDGWQIENKIYSTTYADGNMIGHRDSPPVRSYFWRGEPHNSPSERTISDSLAGKVVNFSEDIGFWTTGIVGLGLPGGDIKDHQVGSLRLGLHDTVFDKPRDFTITGRIIKCDFDTLIAARSYLEDLLRYDNTVDRDQVYLRYRITDTIGVPYGQPLQIPVVYKDGMAGNITNFFQENIGIQFHAATPKLSEVYDSNTELTKNAEYGDNSVFYRDSTGHWQRLGTGITDAVVTGAAIALHPQPIAVDAEFLPMVSGDFNVLCGDAVEWVAYWDGSNWIQIGDFNGMVVEIIPSTYPDTRLYMGGDFVTESGGTCARIAVWDGSGISELADGLDERVRIMAIGPDGWLYITGEFDHDRPGVKTFNYFAQYDPDTDTMYPVDAAHPGLNTYTYDCVITPDNWLWVTGDFTMNWNSDQMVNIARMNLSLPYDERIFEAIPNSLGIITNVKAISVNADGSVYITATKDGGVRLLRWSGETWQRIGKWVGAVDGDYPFHWWGPDGKGYATLANMEIPNVDQWNYSITHTDQFGPVEWAFDDGSEAAFNTMRFGDDGSIITTAWDQSGFPTITGAATTIVTNEGSAAVYPIIRILGPATLKCILNRTTGAEIWFNHGEDFTAYIADGETFFIDLTKGRTRIYSDKRKSIPNIIYAPSTSITRFWLQPGENEISVLFRDTDASTEVHFIWKNNHWAIDYAA